MSRGCGGTLGDFERFALPVNGLGASEHALKREEGMVDIRPPLVVDDGSAELLQPGQAALDDSAVPTQSPAVLDLLWAIRSCGLASAWS